VLDIGLDLHGFLVRRSNEELWQKQPANTQFSGHETCDNSRIEDTLVPQTMFKVSCWDDRSFEFDPDHTALAVIDMQRDFVSHEGYVGIRHRRRNPLARIIPELLSVLDTARAAKMLIVHTREGYAADGSDVSPYKKVLDYVGSPGPGGPFLIRGFHGHDFSGGFAPAAGEIVVDKAGFSAFFGTNLHSNLTERDITHLILAGVTTQCCVHSTLRDAVERGYFCLTLENCCAAEDAIVHAAALKIIQSENHLFGWLASGRDFTNAFGGNPTSVR
jgi:nicotinamidase-related amidase